MRHHHRLVLSLAAASVAPRPATATETEATQLPPDAAIQPLLDARVEAGTATGIVVGLLDVDGTTTIVQAGTAGPEAHWNPANWIFPVGPVASVLTGTLLADMAQRGEVAPDAPIDGLRPERALLSSERRRAVTLADLATVRGESPDVFATVLDPPSRRGAEPWPDAESGIGLLNRLLASRLGTSWDEAVERRVLEPLGMTSTGLDPAGRMHSTAEDLLRFLAANLELPHTGLHQAMRMAHHPRVRIDPRRTVGLAWNIHSEAGLRTIWQGGATGGSQAFIGFDPDRGIGVVVLAQGSGRITDFGLRLLNPAASIDPPE